MSEQHDVTARDRLQSALEALKGVDLAQAEEALKAPSDEAPEGNLTESELRALVQEEVAKALAKDQGRNVLIHAVEHLVNSRDEIGKGVTDAIEAEHGIIEVVDRKVDHARRMLERQTEALKSAAEMLTNIATAMGLIEGEAAKATPKAEPEVQKSVPAQPAQPAAVPPAPGAAVSSTIRPVGNPAADRMGGPAPEGKPYTEAELLKACREEDLGAWAAEEYRSKGRWPANHHDACESIMTRIRNSAG